MPANSHSWVRLGDTGRHQMTIPLSISERAIELHFPQLQTPDTGAAYETRHRTPDRMRRGSQNFKKHYYWQSQCKTKLVDISFCCGLVPDGTECHCSVVVDAGPQSAAACVRRGLELKQANGICRCPTAAEHGTGIRVLYFIWCAALVKWIWTWTCFQVQGCMFHNYYRINLISLFILDQISPHPRAFHSLHYGR